MEIITSLKVSELEQIITDSIQKCLNGTTHSSQPELDDRIGIADACIITGYTKSTLYKKVFNKEVPYKKYGKRLVFSRKELAEWIEANTILKPSASDAMDKRLAEAGKKKRSL